MCIPRLPDANSSLLDLLKLNKCPHFNDVTFVTVSHSRCDMILVANRMDLMRHHKVWDMGPLTLYSFCTPLGWTVLVPEPDKEGM